MKKLIFIIIIIGLTVSGCKSANEYDKECKEFAFQELKKKYGENFVYDGTVPNRVCYSIFCDPAKYYMKTTNKNSPLYDKIINVTIENARSENKILFDNYVALKYENDVHELLESLTKKYFTNVKFFHGSSLSESSLLTNKTTFQEYLLDNSTHISSLIEIKESDFELDKIKQLGEEWFSKIANTDILIIVSKNGTFGTFSEDELRRQAIMYDYWGLKAYGRLNKLNNDSKIEIYRDNVVARKYDSQLKEYLNSVVIKYFPNAIFNSYYNNRDENYDLDLNISFEDYLRERDVPVSISYGIKEEDYSKELLDKVINEYINVGLEFHFELYILDDDYVEGSYMSAYPVNKVIKDLNKEVVYKLNYSN